MSNLASLVTDGTISLAEADAYEPMTENDIAQILQFGMEDMVVNEMLEAYVEDPNVLLEGVVPGEEYVMERTIVRLDKAAKKRKAYKLAIFQCAKEKDDKDYKKLETTWQIEKFLTRKLEKKYAQQAKARMKQAAKKAPKNSIGNRLANHLKKSGNVLTKAQRETQKAFNGVTKIPSNLNSQFSRISSSISSKIK